MFVGLYAWRYGYIPQGAEVSITKQEFIEAEQRYKKRRPKVLRPTPVSQSDSQYSA